MPKYRILSIDGGGIRGLIPAIIVQKLSEVPGLTGWLDRTDLFAGTSTGGLLALALAGGLTPATIRDLYIDKGAQIFADSWLDNLLDLGKILGADYSGAPLQEELQQLFGQRRLQDLARRVLITAFDLDNADSTRRTWKPKIFHNFLGDDSDGDRLVYKVGLYTAAAPTYFPSVDGFIDGGVFATNPSLCALAQSQDARFNLGLDLKDIVLLSLGTGQSLFHLPKAVYDWGYAQWVKPLLRLMLDGVNDIARYQCEQFLGKGFHRLNPDFPADVTIDLDAVDKISYMETFADNLDLQDSIAWLRQNW